VLAPVIKEAAQLHWPGVSFNRCFFNKPSPFVRAQLFEIDLRLEGLEKIATPHLSVSPMPVANMEQFFVIEMPRNVE
jgi:hypothetical protein